MFSKSRTSSDRNARASRLASSFGDRIAQPAKSAAATAGGSDRMILACTIQCLYQATGLRLITALPANYNSSIASTRQWLYGGSIRPGEGWPAADASRDERSKGAGAAATGRFSLVKEPLPSAPRAPRSAPAAGGSAAGAGLTIRRLTNSTASAGAAAYQVYSRSGSCPRWGIPVVNTAPTFAFFHSFPM